MELGRVSPALRWETLPRHAFRVVTPSFLDCVGPSFSPIWDEYHTLSLEWAAYYRRHAVNGQFFISPEKRDLVDRLALMTHSLITEWLPIVEAERGGGLDKVIHGIHPASSLRGVCYYGLIQCLWHRAQFIFLTSDLQQPDGIRPNEALSELLSAMQLLGTDFRADYLASSRWPAESLEIHLSLQQQRLVMIPADQRPTAPPALGLDAKVPRDNFFTLGDAESRLMSGDLVVSAFGSHAALVSEPVTMVRLAFPEWKIRVNWFLRACRFRDPLHHYHCRLNCALLGECSFGGREESDRHLLTLTDFAAEGVGEADEMPGDPTIPGLLAAARALWEGQPMLQQSSLIICTLPLVCTLLRAATPLPILGYFAMWAFLNPLPGIGEWGMMHFAEMGMNSDQNAFAFSNSLLADLSAHQTGNRFPVVRPYGLYAYQFPAAGLPRNPFAQFDENTGRQHMNVVVPRSWLTMETSFLHMLLHFVEGVQPAFPLNFTVARSATSRSTAHPDIAFTPPPEGERLADILARDENVFLDSRQMLLYRAAMFLPQAPNMLSFYEMHSMHLPMFIPRWDWLFRLYEQHRYAKPSFVDRSRDASASSFMQPPLCNHFIWTKDAGDAFKQFMMLYDTHFEAKLPGVRTFESFPSLLDGLLFTDFGALRESMRAHNEESFKPAIRWYRSAILHLMVGW
eukprot:TRINITY_DN23021_c0_g1_i1.p1 TRINITY_DN23021_c0_g1~~TRINITY_DN23021_c0_g1_i1.p1  ORF type:complete len:683 (-),score=75.32 TRINITY_DN23021_c0_g1_i1:231-2279(-)